ncbi:glycosyl transferase family protein [Maritimibacter sp. UBA3975]|uniref:glycosyl transferase family protein n=1 Tax=Maritimibacter sp. UBA3975 TaxID=1946833 RepID=UPI000C0A7622|nr:glycosyl transferase family protein [Maritimibacter sp. UBA3975]MAM63491.1 glycosyl transferase [Maritimibacter sp.]|tara:strand:+ start:117211 stop:118239 length:1029 start_codon:yes stop_codon:yes gene_type:complete
MNIQRPFTAENPHPFAPYVAILARGKTKQRPFTFEEARDSMAMILRGEALPEQIGAYLMLLRLKEETPEEIAGFVEGTRATFDRPADLPQVDLDWSCYAGKRVQLPWFILSLLALVQSGMRVVLHGAEGHTPGRVYTRDVFARFDLPVANSFVDAATQVEKHGMTYMPLEVLSPVLRDLIELKPVLGLRSPVNSFTRLLNPFDAPTVMQGIFHRGFLDIHSGAARILGIPNMAVFRGDGGEIEMRANKPCPVWTTHGSAEPEVDTWPATLDEGHAPADEVMDIERLRAVWAGEDEDPYALAAIQSTLALALRTMGRADSRDEAMAAAASIWSDRDRARFAPR